LNLATNTDTEYDMDTNMLTMIIIWENVII
jgi:hypothetical protein